MRRFAFAGLVLCALLALGVHVIWFVKDRAVLRRAHALVTREEHVVPTAQKSLLEQAISETSAGQYRLAIPDFRQAVALDPVSEIASEAIYRMARAQVLAGKKPGALRTVSQLAADYPDSSWHAQAKLLEADIRGESNRSAEQIVASQNAGKTEFRKAVDARDAGRTTEALAMLQASASSRKGTPVELQARETIGNLLAFSGQTSAAIEAFEALLADVKKQSPRARITQIAQLRLGYLNLRPGGETDLEESRARRERAYVMFTGAQAGLDKALAREAALQAIGAQFEAIQREKRMRVNIAPERWQRLHASCEAIKHIEGVTSATCARADLMNLEVFSWQGDYNSVVSAGYQFIKCYNGDELTTDVATARFFLGEQLHTLNRLPEAIEQYRWIVERYSTQTHIWPDTDLLPRTYLRLWQCLVRLKADPAEIESIETIMANRFPTSSWTEHLRGQKRNPPLGGTGLF